MANNIDVRTSLALSKDAVVVADIGTLTSNGGVPLALEKGDNHVVGLFPTLCCDHHASRAVPQMKHPAAAFDTAEHIITVADCKLKLADGKVMSALQERLRVGPNLYLTYGQVIGLGGDFYGDPDRAVCKAGDQEQQIDQFRKNFENLEISADEVKKILQIAQRYEFNPIAEAVVKGKVPSGVYQAIPATETPVGTDEDKAFDEVTGGDWRLIQFFNFNIKIPVKQGRYLRLAATNFDHFGVDAITCYMAGHIKAQREASDAKRSAKPEQLLRAYAINAFADHFLTDLFAAGHMRTPRRALWDSAWTEPTRLFASLCAKRMHDEDNKFGLWVTNKLGDHWVAYGDARYRDAVNTANRRIMKRALQQSMDEVWDAYQTGQIRDHSNSKVLDYLPTIITEITVNPTARDDAQNWPPLFWRDPKGELWLRSRDPANPAVRDYFVQGSWPWPRQWGLTEVALAILGMPLPFSCPAVGPPRMPLDEYKRAGLQVFPDEAGPSGEFGWPPEPRSITGWSRVMHGATGPELKELRSVDWRIDGTPGPPQ